MDDAKRELVRVWFIKAQRDFDTARQISGLPDGHLTRLSIIASRRPKKRLKAFSPTTTTNWSALMI
jgi:hypothetical protein